VNPPNLKVDLGKGLVLANPIVAASGTYGYGTEYAGICPPQDWGAVVLKSVSLHPRIGNVPQRITETPCGMLNSIGLANVGLSSFLGTKLDDLKDFIELGAVVVANLAAESLEEFVELTRRISDDGRVRALEINISCPNVSKGGMQFGTDCGLAAEVVAACRRNTQLPLWVKLSPNVTNPVAIAQACVNAGADVLVAGNTLLGMKIDTVTRKPTLGNIFGGLSGPAIRPVNLRIAWQIHQALPEIPLIGCGGVEDADSALEYILAGCSAVEIGTATFREPRIIYAVLDGIRSHLEATDIGSITELIGAAARS
jgi:dihydroorotate dehydrogenase (NAD+) catalytic subunit